MVFEGVKSAQDGTFQSANISVGRTTPGSSGITFKPVTALVKFTTARTDIKTIVLTGGSKFKKGVTVNGFANCLVIAPDDYSGTIVSSYDATAWAAAESNGLVCLPAAGRRDGSVLSNGGSKCYYWSATPLGSDKDRACRLFFDDSSVDPSSSGYRSGGYSVRLVYSAAPSAPVYPEAPELACVKIGDVWWAPVNCGYDATHTYGLLYQWGRKYGQGYDSKPLPLDAAVVF